MFRLEDLVTVARRENNPKRKYLYVNPLQGKHIPVSPALAMGVFSETAARVRARYPGERLLVIGFAETATAIGAALALMAGNASWYYATSREDIPGAEYLFFTEAHSHATEQRLAVNGLDAAVAGADRIVFAEDEVTTGNTIMNIVGLLRERYQDQELRFGIVSILNSMSDTRLRELQEQGVYCDYLLRIPFQYRIDSVDRDTYLRTAAEPLSDSGAAVPVFRTEGYWNARLPAPVPEIRALTERFTEEAMGYLAPAGIPAGARVLVLGTEEFMYPGLSLGARLEQERPDLQVRFHATTRSPIEVSPDPDYPLHSRETLVSLYDRSRRTFIYNLERYDRVLAVTDAAPCPEGLGSLVAALRKHGNTNIALVKWGDFQ